RSGEPEVHLAMLVEVRVIPARAGGPCHELEHEGLARPHRLLCDAGDAVHRVRHVDAMPVDGRRLRERILQDDTEALALAREDRWAGDVTVVGHRADGLARRQLPRHLPRLEMDRADRVGTGRGSVAAAAEVGAHTGRGRAGPQAGERAEEITTRVDHWHFASIVRLISSGEANTMDARSPCMPAGSSTGLPLDGPIGLESVLKRRLNSQRGMVRPSSVVTW